MGLFLPRRLTWVQFNFDVFNALTVLDNPLFLEQLKFGAGDGQLNYYLYNYWARPIAGGVDAKNIFLKRLMREGEESQMGA